MIHRLAPRALIVKLKLQRGPCRQQGSALFVTWIICGVLRRGLWNGMSKLIQHRYRAEVRRKNLYLGHGVPGRLSIPFIRWVHQLGEPVMEDIVILRLNPGPENPEILPCRYPD